MVTTLPDSKSFLKEAWETYRKRLIFYTLISLPVLLGVKVIFEFLVSFATLFQPNTSQGQINILIYQYAIFLLIYGYFIRFIRTILLLQLDRPMNLFASVKIAINKFPAISKVVYEVTHPNFTNLIYILENVSYDEAVAKSNEYIKGDQATIEKRLSFASNLKWGSFIAMLPFLPAYALSDNRIFLLLLILFAVFYLLNFILETIYMYCFYKFVKQHHSSLGTILLPNDSLASANQSKLDAHLMGMFHGRLSRRSFWIGNSILLAVEIVAGLVFGSFSRNEYAFMLIFIASSFWVVYGFSFLIRRVHDLSKNYWYCFQLVIPIYGLFVWLRIAFDEGTKGVNDFGPHVEKQSLKTIFSLKFF